MLNHGKEAITLSLSGVTNSWPLIRYVADDPVYFAAYKQYVSDFATNIFTTEKMNALFTYNHELIAPYVSGPDETEEGDYTYLTSQTSFTNSPAELNQHVATRLTAVSDFLK